MKLKAAIANYLAAKEKLESVLGEVGTVTNEFNGTIKVWTIDVNLMADADNIQIEHGKGEYLSRLVTGDILGAKVHCIAYPEDIRKVLPQEMAQANYNDESQVAI